MVDSSSIRVRQHAANVKKGSSGGCDRRGWVCRASVLKLTEGQAHDGRSAADMLDSVGKGQMLLADRALDSDALRETLQARGAWANVKPEPGRVRRPAFSP